MPPCETLEQKRVCQGTRCSRRDRKFKSPIKIHEGNINAVVAVIKVMAITEETTMATMEMVTEAVTTAEEVVAVLVADLAAVVVAAEEGEALVEVDADVVASEVTF